MRTTMAMIIGMALPTLGMAFGIPLHKDKWLLPEKGEEEGETIRLSDRKVVNSEVDAVDYDRYCYQPPYFYGKIY